MFISFNHSCILYSPACKLIAIILFWFVTSLNYTISNGYAIFSILFFTYGVLNALRRKAWISFFLLTFIVQFLITITLKYVSFIPAVTSWRKLYYAESLTYDAIYYCYLSLGVINTISLLFNASVPSPFYQLLKSNKEAKLFSMACILFLFLFGLVDFWKVFEGRDAYLDSRSNLPFMEVFSILTYFSITNYNTISRSIVGRVCLILKGVMLVFLLASGFRGLFLAAFVICYSFWHRSKNVDYKITAAVFIALFSVFIIVGITRSKDRSFDDVFSSLGVHEENEMYTVVIASNNSNNSPHNTYISSLLRVMGINYGSSLSASYLFCKNYLPASISESNLNMGLCYAAEAIWNYGKAKGLIFISFFTLFVFFIERSEAHFFGLKIILLAQTYGIVYYGSTNYMSMIFNGTLIYGLIFLIIYIIRRRFN